MLTGFPVRKCALLADPRPKDKSRIILAAIDQFVQAAARRGIETDVFQGVPINAIQPADDVDMFVVLGGDGTMIHYAGPLSKFKKPFYGLNYGNVGFMMNQVTPEMEDNTERLWNGSFIMWEFPLLKVEAVDLEGRPHHGFGLNDIYLQRMTAQTCRVNLAIRDVPLAFNPVLCDGIIVSTPLGSTAYAFNVTGAVVAVDCPAITITPIAANRTCPIKSLVLSMQANVTIEVLEPHKRKVMIVSDSLSHGNIARAEIKMGDDSVRLCFTTDTPDLPLRLVNKCRV